MKDKPKRKVIPLHYRRNNLSRTLSNTSLSQLRHIASYKKRINDLTRNNRLLATALQESRIEAAIQNNLLKDYTRDSNHILFARFKLNEMAKNLAKFVTDLEEVRNYLNIDLPSDNFLNQKKGSPSDRIAKVPNVDCIEEVSEFSLENVDTVADTPLEAVEAVNEMPAPSSSNKNSDAVPGNAEFPIDPEDNDIEMAPILFVDDNEEKKKSSCRSKRSRVSSGMNKGSLTPELNIEVTNIKLKRKSSRRMSSFVFPETRNTKSREKTPSCGKKNSSEELVTPVMPVIPPLLHCEQNKADKIEEILASPFIENVKQRNNENASNVLKSSSNISPPKMVGDDSHIPSTHPVVDGTAFPTGIQTIECNHTVIACEDMELTEVIRPVDHIILEKDPLRLNKPADNLQTNVITSEDVCDNFNSDGNIPEVNAYPKSVAAVLSDDDIILPEINEYSEEIQNVGTLTFCDPSDNQKEERQNSMSTPPKPKRSKKLIKYAVFFSSDEESPQEKSQNKSKIVKKVSKSKIATDSLHKEKKLPSKSVPNDPENVCNLDISVYNLDVSNSEKINKKNSKKSAVRKSKLKEGKSGEKEPKPLLQKCAVTKLKAGCYKFSKSEVRKPDVIPKDTEKHTSPLFSPSGILKKTHTDHSTANVEKEHDAMLNRSEWNDNLDDSSLSIKQLDLLETPSKRVSFASTDLVCNFGKMSVSKKIANNKKVRRTSKSVLNPQESIGVINNTKALSHCNADNFFEDTTDKELIPEVLESKEEFNQGSIISSEALSLEDADPAPLFNFSDDTELYTFAPTNKRIPILPDDSLHRSDTIIQPTDSQEKNMSNDKSSDRNELILKKVQSIAKSPPRPSKLSLKRNKNSHNVVSLEIVGEDKPSSADLFESPICTLKSAKRKSLFKELSEKDDIKENICLDQSPKRPEDTPQIDTFRKSFLPSQNESNKMSYSSKRQSKINSKASAKKNKLSNKQKPSHPTSETKSKKKSLESKSREGSPALKDLQNFAVLDDVLLPRRRSKAVSYKEPSLTKKLRRE